MYYVINLKNNYDKNFESILDYTLENDIKAKNNATIWLIHAYYM